MFLISFFSLVSISSAAITCSQCYVGSCKCSITDCSSGTFGVYNAFNCSGFPLYYTDFSGGSVTWSPSQTGTYYMRVFCGGIGSACVSQQVSSITTTTQEGGFPPGCKREGYVCTAISTCCPGLACVESTCMRIPTSTTTTVTETTATTAVGKEYCPFECCENEDAYYDKGCPENQICKQNSCVMIVKADNTFYYVILAVFAIIIPLIIIFFMFRRSQSEWKKLYKKWSAKRR